MTEFVHLHVHTQFSLLDGAVKVKDLVKRVASLKQRAVAITDHGNMFGALGFHKAAKEANVQSILGCEIGHLPLLAATNEGYKNLLWLASHATALPRAEPGVHIEPADLERARASYLLAKLEGHTKGLVALTGCMGGPLGQRILYEGEHQGNHLLGQLRELFEPGALYVELQDHGLPEQAPLNTILTQLAQNHGMRTVATNDVHYAERADAEAHLVLGCIKSQRSLVAARDGHHGSSEMYLKTGDEMAERFPAAALAATLEIAEKCAGLKLNLGKPMLPTFPVPPGYTTESYFRETVWEGLRGRLALPVVRIDRGKDARASRDVYEKRLAFELDVIAKMNFPGYFLIVWDFIRFAKERGISVGPGRGSGAGSLVAYALRITDLDPIQHGLLFERFLNPDRVSMPDFDIDFCMSRRDEVVAYVRQKYGVESVGQIATFMELKARSVLKDVARALGLPPQEAQKIANLVPPGTQTKTTTIAESLELEPKLRAPEYHEVVTYAQKLEGLTRHVGVHAAGIVISEGPLWDHVPVFQDDAAHFISQYSMNDVEAAGLVKFDFLGLKTLTVLEIARKLIGPLGRGVPDAWRQAYGTVLAELGVPQGGLRLAAQGELREPVDSDGLLDLNRLPLDDPEVYKLLTTGETKGVFQLESTGMQQLFRDMKPDRFGDVVAGVALYRPGPLGAGMTASYVARKNGRERIASFHPLVDEHLKDTYGVVVYQEQVMQTARSLSGYTLAEADMLRRAMGKKKPEEMAKQRDAFVGGAVKNGVEAVEATRIFNLFESFSSYAFNLSHSAGYALLTYQTAYLKVHYPVEFLCAILTCDQDKSEKVIRTLADAVAMGIEVLPPDLNRSELGFRVENDLTPGAKAIRFGLAAIQGLGEAALEGVLEKRPFKDLFDVTSRVDIKKGVLEKLVQCGALDSMGIERAKAFATIPLALQRAKPIAKDAKRGQLNWFSSGETVAVFEGTAAYADVPAWDQREKLARERKALGFYVSGHPLDRYAGASLALERWQVVPIDQCDELADGAMVRLIGMVQGYRVKEEWNIAFFELGDRSGQMDAKLRSYDAYGAVLERGEPVLISGRVKRDETEDGEASVTLLVRDVRLLADVVKTEARAAIVTIRAPATLEPLKEVLEKARGSVPVGLRLVLETGVVSTMALPQRVEVGEAFLAGVERAYGSGAVEVR